MQNISVNLQLKTSLFFIVEINHHYKQLQDFFYDENTFLNRSGS